MFKNKLTGVLTATFCALLIAGCNGSSDESGSRNPGYREGNTYNIFGSGGFGPHPVLTDTFEWTLSLSEMILENKVILYDAELGAGSLSIGGVGTIDEHTHGMDCYDEDQDDPIRIDSVDGTIDIMLNPFDEDFREFNFEYSETTYSARILLVNGVNSNEAHLCVTYSDSDGITSHQIYRTVSLRK